MNILKKDQYRGGPLWVFKCKNAWCQQNLACSQISSDALRFWIVLKMLGVAHILELYQLGSYLDAYIQFIYWQFCT